MEKTNKFILIIGFGLILFGFMAVTVFTPDRQISEVENRALATFPQISKDSILSGEFFKNFETYFTDQFFGRDQFVQAYTYSEVKQDKINVNDVIVGEDGWLFTPPAAELRTEKIDRTVRDLKRFMDLKPAKTEVVMSLVPHKSNILMHIIPPYFDHNYGYDNTKYFIQHRPEEIHIIDMQQQFQENFSESGLNSFYFKTDHHWNINGAYEAYKQTIESMSQQLDNFEGQALERSQLTEQCLPNKNYNGSLNQQLYLLYPTTGENLCSLSPSMEDVKMTAVDNEGNKKTELSQIFGTGLDQPSIRYTNLFTSDYPIIQYVNEQVDNDLHVLILKDSYANPVQALFAQHFEETTVLDLRYYTEKSVLALLEEQDIDIVLMFYNNSNLFGDAFRLEN